MRISDWISDVCSADLEMRRDRDILGAQHLVGVDQLALLFGRKFGILEIGAGEAGFDQPDLDVLLGQLLAERRQEALNAGLRCDIDRAARRLRYRGHRPDEAYVASRRQAPRRYLRAAQIGGEVG